MDNYIDNIIIILFILLIILILLIYLDQFITYRTLITYPAGCRGTRWGCCPDNITTKLDIWGSNCYPRPTLLPQSYTKH